MRRRMRTETNTVGTHRDDACLCETYAGVCGSLSLSLSLSLFWVIVWLRASPIYKKNEKRESSLHRRRKRKKPGYTSRNTCIFLTFHTCTHTHTHTSSLPSLGVSTQQPSPSLTPSFSHEASQSRLRPPHMSSSPHRLHQHAHLYFHQASPRASLPAQQLCPQ